MIFLYHLICCVYSTGYTNFQVYPTWHVYITLRCSYNLFRATLPWCFIMTKPISMVGCNILVMSPSVIGTLSVFWQSSCTCKLSPHLLFSASSESIWFNLWWYSSFDVLYPAPPSCPEQALPDLLPHSDPPTYSIDPLDIWTFYQFLPLCNTYFL